MRALGISVIFLAVFVILTNTAVDFIKKGSFEKYLDSHPMSVNPRIEYYLAITLNLANRKNRSYHWYQRVYTKYPESEFAPIAWADAIEILYILGQKKQMEEEANRFLEKYPSHPKAELIRRKVFLIKNVY